MKRRQTFQAAGWDALEDRQLLSYATARPMLARQHAVQVHQMTRAHANHAPRAQMSAAALRQLANRMIATTPKAAATPYVPSTSYTLVPTPAVNTGGIRTRGITIPENGRQRGPVMAGPTAAYPTTTLGSATAQTAGLVRAGTAVSTASAGTAVGTIAASPVSATPLVVANTPTVAATPGSAGTGTMASTPTTAIGTAAPAGTTLSTKPSTTPPPVQTASILPAKVDPSVPAMPPTGVMPIAPPLGGATLSKADVTTLKTAVDAFAASYTSGADATKDRAAVGALDAALHNLAVTVWSESHVTSKDAVAAFQQAADDFAKNYTGGLDATKDAAAWTALQTAMTGLMKSDAKPGDAPAPPPLKGAVPLMPGAFDPSMLHIDTTLAAGPALTADEVSQLKGLVATFASDYTSGADAAKDQAAATALVTGLDDLFDTHWSDVANPNPGVGAGPGIVVPLSAPTMPILTTQAPPPAAPATPAPAPIVVPINGVAGVSGEASSTGWTTYRMGRGF